MDFNEQKRGLMFAMTNTLRTSRLVDMVNVQEASTAFGMVLNDAQPGKPVDLSRFHRWLVDEKKCPQDAVAEALLFFKSRGSRYQVTIALPPELESVDEAQQAKIVSSFVQRGASSGTYASFKAADVKETSGAKPAPQKPADPKKKPAGSSSRTALLAALALVALAGGALTMYVNGSAPQGLPPMTITDPGALPCAQLSGGGGYTLCRIRAADAAALSPADLKKAALITKAAAARQGNGDALHVFTLETNQRLATF